MSQLVPLRKRAQLLLQKPDRNKHDLFESLSIYTESLSVFCNDPIASVERAMVYACLGFPELAFGDAIQAHVLFKSIQLSDSVNLAYTIDNAQTDGSIIIPSDEKIKEYSDNAYTNICYILASALTKLNLHTDSLYWYKECARLATGEDKRRFEGRIRQITLSTADTTIGCIPHTISRYPWDVHDLRAKTPTAILVDIRHRIKQSSGSCLTVREQTRYESRQLQLGTYAKKDIQQPQTILVEPSIDILCVNSGICSKPVCDNCNTDIQLEIYHCRRCNVAFCNESCFLTAQSKHHGILCAKNIDAISNNISSSSTTKSLIPLLILRAFAIAIATNVHPLDLPSVRYLSSIQYETNLHRQYDTRSFDDFRTITSILGLQSFTPNFDYLVFLTLNNIFTSNTFAIKATDGIPWKMYILPRIGMVNHSCAPNAVLLMDGSEFSIKTLGCLQKGTEVCISYTVFAPDTTKDERRRILLNGWGFVCKCIKCM